MRLTPVVLLVAALVTLTLSSPSRAASPVLELGADGNVHVRQDRFLPTAELPAVNAPAPAAPAHAAGSGATLASGMRRLAAGGEIDAQLASRGAQIDAGARKLVKHLKGRRRVELAAVLANADAQASDGLLTGSRLPLILETLRRNVQWWERGPLIAYGRRVRFAGSRLVWESYPGQGIQVQWLGTFGRMNQLFLAHGYDTELGLMADEVARYAVQRAGGIAWEYEFQFGGGRPPWISGLAQGTAVQALARAAVRLRRPALLETARSALGVFRTPPPSGVRVRTAAGAHYLAYSYAPGQRIYNAFFQSVIGLHDFGQLANDPLGLRLWLDGEREAAVELRSADSGAWSYYQPGVPSDLGYHRVLRDFVRGLCDRLIHDRQVETLRVRAIFGPATVLEELDRLPDPEPFCLATQSLNAKLYTRLRALGQPVPPT